MDTEKTAGSNLTPIAEYSETAAALGELRQRHQGVVFDVTKPKEMKAAKEARAELRTLRTGLEKKRVEIKAPALERCRLIDAEARRITAELVALEEPIDVQIKAEEARAESEHLAKLEAERLRVEAIQQKIQAIRDVPAGLVGKPSVVIAGQLANLQKTVLDEAELAEHYVTATDALAAAIARVEQLLAAQHEAEAEQKRIAAEREELARIRAENERLQREAEERRQADERRAAEERFEAERKERERIDAILARIDGIAAMARNLDGLTTTEIVETRRALQTMHPDTSGADFAEFKDHAIDAWDIAEATLSTTMERREQQDKAARRRAAEEQVRREEEARQREEEEARLQAERERQAAEQRKLDEQAAQLKREREAAAKKAEADRMANLGLREAAEAAVAWFVDEGRDDEQVCTDLKFALSNDTAAHTVNRGKKVAA